MPRSIAPPKYNRQKNPRGNDRAFVNLDGKRIYLGQWGTAESKAKYRKLIAADQGGAKFCTPLPSTPTVNQLLVAYFDRAQVYYGDHDGELSEEYHHQRRAAAMLREAVGTKLAKDIGPKRMKLIREEMIAKDWPRNFINDQFKRLVRMFKWAASEEMIPPAVHDAMQKIEGLRKGRSKARESKIVRSFGVDVVTATLAHLPDVVADMVRVQRLTGCRPGEMLKMSPCDIDRSGDVWLYTSEHHKTERHSHSRIIAIGPKAQKVLLLYLTRDAQSCCFQPRDSELKRLSARSVSRITPQSCGSKPGSNRKDSPQRAAGDAYSIDSYRRAIARAAKRAGVGHWCPNQLRHSAATEASRSFGPDSAQSMLGHKNAAIT